MLADYYPWHESAIVVVMCLSDSSKFILNILTKVAPAVRSTVKLSKFSTSSSEGTCSNFPEQA